MSELPPSGHYVYLLLDRGVPFYVGKGSGQRAFDHLNEAAGRKTHNKFKVSVIRKLRREGRQVEYRYLSCPNADTAFKIESILIRALGRRGIDREGLLTNRAPGGCGGNVIPPEEVTAVAAKRSKCWANKTDAELAEINSKIRATKEENGTWRKPSDWTLSAANMDRLKEINPWKKKAVQQFTLDGTLIATYDSTLSAAKESGAKTSQGSISNACSGRQKTAGGFTWGFV